MTVIDIQPVKLRTILLIFVATLLTLDGYTFLVFDVSRISSIKFLYHEEVSETVNEIIEKTRLGSIRKEFPEELLDKT